MTGVSFSVLQEMSRRPVGLCKSYIYILFRDFFFSCTCPDDRTGSWKVYDELMSSSRVIESKEMWMESERKEISRKEISRKLTTCDLVGRQTPKSIMAGMAVILLHCQLSWK